MGGPTPNVGTLCAPLERLVALSTLQLRELGAKVDQAICVIDRSGGDAPPLLEAGVAIHAIYTPDELEAAAKKRAL